MTDRLLACQGEFNAIEMDAVHDGAKTAKDDPNQLRPGLEDPGSSGGGGGSEGGGRRRRRKAPLSEL